MDADEVESMEALVNSDQVNSVGKAFAINFIIALGEVLETYRTPALDGVVVLGQNVSQLVMEVVEETSVIIVLLLLLDNVFEPIIIGITYVNTYSASILSKISSNCSLSRPLDRVKLNLGALKG